jgi:hypothetical protein
MDEDGSRFVRGRKPKVMDDFSLEEHRAQTRRSIRREFLLAHHGLVRRRLAGALAGSVLAVSTYWIAVSIPWRDPYQSIRCGETVNARNDKHRLKPWA